MGDRLLGFVIGAVLAGSMAGCGAQAKSPGPTATGSARPSATPGSATHPPKPMPTLAMLTSTASIPLAHPTSIAASEDVVWVTTAAGLARIDAATRAVTVVAYGSGSHQFGGVALTAGAAWVTDFDANTLYRVDTRSNAVVATIPVGTWPEWIAATEDGVWVANHRSGSVSRIDARTGRVVATIHVGPADFGGPQGVAFGFGSIWVAVGNAGPNGTIVRIDPATNAVAARIELPATGFTNGNPAFTGDAAWIPSGDGARTIARIDPATNSVVTLVQVSGESGSPFIVDGKPWFAIGAPARPQLLRVDPVSNTVDRRLALPDRVRGDQVIVAGFNLWLVATGSIEIIPVSALDRP